MTAPELTADERARVAAFDAAPQLAESAPMTRAMLALAEELEAPDVVARLLKEHQFSEHTAGNGYTEPREAWAECSCGVTLFAWQQHYDEGDDRAPHAEYAAHIAVLVQQEAAAHIRATVAAVLAADPEPRDAVAERVHECGCPLGYLHRSPCRMAGLQLGGTQ